ncbi:acetyl-CoA carboxylase biotin carboxyl carrier protein [uncultured Abiotrophia sp.]|jgi:acetyl-coA carboxylase, biotin carboxyl carrier protein|uniref:acetyl-CoA carboxylase biotin carboxyl carrier protein n=1 Tax=uncultured Abiotrophia sp. TaxID=316094 RepID=UPI0028D8A2A6|nr:acetyl-CoA carboxylase biotin carboxyl carrier protein [uncultured Abiotrophia sp.]
MQYEELVKLIDKLDQSSLAYFEFTNDNERLLLAKEVPQVAAPAPVVVTDVTESAALTAPASLAAPAPVAAPEVVEAPAAPAPALAAAGKDVPAPMVGVVYLQANPDADPYVQVGDSVKKGQVLCLIEAMKLMNEIVAPQDGVVSAILVENENIVEYGQALFRIS